ncbi:MAG TPA: glycerol-3-phosphate dehydrogenase [Dongiaceae bacterium]
MDAPNARPDCDLLVIGGGINGAAIACDAAGRGAAVILAEQRDFAEGTSSRSSKLIHGGLRYLETYDFRMVREALIEREILMAKAAHLVRPLRLVLPHVAGQRPLWLIRLGLILYDHIAPRRHLAASETLGLASQPAGNALKPEFRRGFAYSDCRGDDARLVIANLLGAQRHGATILARHAFVSAARDGVLWRCRLKNMATSEQRHVSARAIANAAGPWVMQAAGCIGGFRTERKLRLVKGSHLVVRRQWPEEHGYFLQTADGRLMEAFPYEDDFTSIGTTDEPWEGAPEDVVIAEKEIDYMLSEVNRFFRRPVTRGDIAWQYAGVRPLFEVGGGRDANLSTLTRDYSFEIDHADGQAALLTVFGGKLTTHRKMAGQAVDKLSLQLGLRKPSRTATEQLPGGDFGTGGFEEFEMSMLRAYGGFPATQIRRYVRLYGTRIRDLLAGAASPADLGRCVGADLHEREVEFLMSTEWAQTAEDIVWRRTKLGLRLTAEEIEAVASYVRAHRVKLSA